MARGTFFRWETERQFSVTSESSLQTHLKLKFDDTKQGSLRFDGTPSISLLPESSPFETEKRLRLSCNRREIFRDNNETPPRAHSAGVWAFSRFRVLGLRPPENPKP